MGLAVRTETGDAYLVTCSCLGQTEVGEVPMGGEATCPTCGRLHAIDLDGHYLEGEEPAGPEDQEPDV